MGRNTHFLLPVIQYFRVIRMKLEIYGTLGPSCCTTEIIEDLLKSGMTGMRLNLSHCDLEERTDWIQAFHQACNQLKIKADLMIDMRGPELRTLNSMPLHFEKDSLITFEPDTLPKPIFEHAEVNDILLMDDGKIQMQILEVSDYKLHCIVRFGTELKTRKSVMIQGKQISGPLFTERDLKNLKNAKTYGVTSIMQPFVSSKEDLLNIKETLHSLELNELKLYAKIENMTGVEHVEEMMHHCDCLVIARGDLGNACGLIQLPRIQKQIEQLCHLHHQKYMVVTEMLNSMIDHPVPTRAEVSDVYHAIYHGAGAIMLTAETASGQHPKEAMHIFTEVAKTALKDKENTHD